MWNKVSKPELFDMRDCIYRKMDDNLEELYKLNRRLHDELNTMRDRQEALIKHLGVKLVFESATKGHWKVERDAE